MKNILNLKSRQHTNKVSTTQSNGKDGGPCCRLLRLATREGLVANFKLGYKVNVIVFFRNFCQVMQSLLDFGPVLFARSSKFCVWISAKLFSSSNCYYGGTSPRQTPRETVQWMAEHAPVFPVNGKDITVLNEPEQFFATLKV